MDLVPDPDQLVRGTDPDLVPHKNVPNTGSKDKEWGVVSTTLCSSDMF